MKKIFAAAVLVTLAASGAFAAGIATSKHNLSSVAGNTNTIKGAGTAGEGSDQICIYCHTPHNAVSAIPLWNRNDPNPSGYSLYVTGTNLSAAAQASALDTNSVSTHCLSCHDGVAGASSQASVGDRVARNAAGAAKITMAGNWSASGGLFDGANSLTNDHPIGFSYYAAAQDAKHGVGTKDFKPKDTNDATGTTLGVIRFFTSSANGAADSVECASCHLVHDNQYGKFLRMSNAESALCLACHDK